jgi:hypothetical protein
LCLSNTTLVVFIRYPALGAILSEIEREKQYYGEFTSRMTELKKMAALQENIITMMLEKSIEEVYSEKRLRLKIVK